jgi:hypothetical protein
VTPTYSESNSLAATTMYLVVERSGTRIQLELEIEVPFFFSVSRKPRAQPEALASKYLLEKPTGTQLAPFRVSS